MVEMELVTSETIMISSCLRFRASELHDQRKVIYEKLANEISASGLYQFDSFDLLSIYLSLKEYVETSEQILGTSSGIKEFKSLTRLFFEHVFEFQLVKAANMFERQGVCVAS
jgi:hypothetical protein